MGRHAKAIMQATQKALDEYDKLVKEGEKAKTPQEKKKLGEMAAAAHKIAAAHYKSLEAAHQKDWAETKKLFNM